MPPAGAGPAPASPQIPPKPFPVPGIQIDNMPGAPFDVDLPSDTPLRRAAGLAARPLLRWALQLNTFGELYVKAETMGLPRSTAYVHWSYAKASLRVLLDFEPDELPP